VHLTLSIVIVSLGQFLMPRVANVLLVHYAIVIGPGCFSATKVSFVAFRFVAIM
jgi:hypothetical protein